MTNARGFLIRTDGTCEEIRCADYLQAIAVMGCDFFDIVRLSPDADMWIDDMGRINGAKVNPIASILATERTRMPYDLFGDVVVFGHDGKGETTDCPEWVVRWAKALLAVTSPFITPEEKKEIADGPSGG